MSDADPSRPVDDRGRDQVISDTFEAFLRDKGKGTGGESGNYRRDAERELKRFTAWCRGEGDPDDWSGIGHREENRTPTFADLDENVFRQYARFLVREGFTPGTVRTYYAYVSSWCGWAATEGYLDRHYADMSVSRAPLPEDDGRKPGDQQAWNPEERDRITEFVDERAAAAIDELGDVEPEDEHDRQLVVYEAIKACRDRALVYLLCYTAVRGAEILRDPDDVRREGITWSDIDYRDQNVTVFRKKQQWDEASIPDPVIHPLQQYERVLDPPDDRWPVFPTFHYPTLAETVTDGLSARGYDEEEIEAIRDEYARDLLVCGEYDLVPPATTPNAARRVMRRLCSEAGIELDDRHGYLAPHGGRRGMGEVMVRQFGYAAAARYLDASEDTVREHYQHIEAGEQADMATQALAETDQRVRNTEAGDEHDGK